MGKVSAEHGCGIPEVSLQYVESMKRVSVRYKRKLSLKIVGPANSSFFIEHQNVTKMAKQKSPFKIKGTLDDVTFYKTKDGHLAKLKTDVGAQVRTGTSFQRTRENGEEFGRAGKAGKYLRDAFRSLLMTASDGKMTSRLTKEMVKVVKSDPVSDRGMRNVLDGDLTLLQGFGFNFYSNLGSTLLTPFVPAIDRATGKLTVSIPAFSAVKKVAAPEGATHFSIVSAGAAIDFETGAYESVESSSASIPLDNDAVAAIDLENALSANSTKPLFLVAGIEFFQEVNGKSYPIRNGAFNALSLVMVSTV